MAAVLYFNAVSMNEIVQEKPDETVSDELIRPIDAAVRLGLSMSTVYILMRTGELATRMAVVPGRQKPQRMVLASAVAAREAGR